MQRQFFSGNSIEQAVLSAARHHKIEPERLAYTVREKKHGFVNVRKRVVIVVDPDRPERDESEITAAAAAPTGERLAAHEKLKTARAAGGAEGGASRPDRRGGRGGRGPKAERAHEARDGAGSDRSADATSPRDAVSREPAATHPQKGREPEGGERHDRDRATRGRGDRPSKHRDDDRRSRSGSRDNDTATEVFRWSGRTWDADDESPEIQAFEEAIERVLDVMDLEIEYTLEEGDDGFEVDFSGSDANLLVEEDGKALKALENILPRVVRGLVDETIPCEVDCEGFQEKRRRALEDMAREAAKRVSDTERMELLDAMNPADRRIVHLCLVDHPDVETVSEGRGYLKRVKIRPTND